MMNNESWRQRELISALADGQLRGVDFAKAVELAATEPDARETWHAYHVVGDVMRSAQSMDFVRGDDSPAFLARFQSRLEEEMRASGPNATSAQSVVSANLIANQPYSAGTSMQKGAEMASANDANFRWKLVAGIASLAAVAALGWAVMGNSLDPAPSPQLAQANNLQAPETLPQPPQVMIRDPHLDALLAAHKQFGGTSALQMPSGFLRNATFEGPAR